MMLSKFLDPKNDFAFKRIFGTERNKDILIHFINDMLKFTGKNQIKQVKFLPPAQDPDVAYAKQSLVDVLCEDEHGRQYIVEMQVAKTAGFEKRAQYYAAKAYSRQLNHSDEYNNLKEIIFLAITDFVMFPDKKAYKSDHVILDKETQQHDLKDFYFTFLELPKFHKSIDQLSSITEKWAYFFKHAEQTKERDVAKIIGEDLVLQRAFEELNRFSWNEVELNTYEKTEKRERDARAILLCAQEEGIAEGRAAGMSEGMAKGMIEGKAEGERIGEAKGERSKALKIAKTMKQNGYTVEAIISLTELSKEEVEKL